MKIFKDKLKERNGYWEGMSDAIDKESVGKATAYKKSILKRLISINPKQINSRLDHTLYWVTRKYGGECVNLFIENGQAFIINQFGRIRTGLPCMEDAVSILKKNGISQAIIPAELYTFGEKKTNDTFHLACYDLLELNGLPYKPDNYGQTLKELDRIFEGGKLVRAADWKEAANNREVKKLFTEWVEKEGSEGIIVRSETPFIWKIKPRRHLNAVVTGFTEGTGDEKGQVRTLLLALTAEESKYQVITHIGEGITQKQKHDLYAYFSPRVMPSEFIETDSNHVAFQMVKPDKVVELSVNDVHRESPEGSIQNPVLEIVEGEYRLAETVNGISFVAPAIERFRDGKQGDAKDARLSQIEDISNFDPADIRKIPFSQLPRSEVIFREVYKKTIGEKIMILKFTGWKTNKETSGDWPAYVLHTTNFSSNRQQHLLRDVEITNDYDQLFELLEKAIDANVKKGWVKVE